MRGRERARVIGAGHAAAEGEPTGARLVARARTPALAHIVAQLHPTADGASIGRRPWWLVLLRLQHFKEGLIYQTFGAAQGRAAESGDCKSLDS